MDTPPSQKRRSQVFSLWLVIVGLTSVCWFRSHWRLDFVTVPIFDKAFRVGWEPGTDRPPVRWRAADGPVVAVAVSPDGRTVATAGPAGPVRLWSAADAAPAGEVRGASGSAALAFAADGDGWLLVAAGREDGVLRVFDRTGREVRNPAGHAEPIQALAVSPDGALAASAGPDEGVCVWDLRTGLLRALLRGHDRPVRALRFGPEKGVLFTASEDGRVKAWDVDSEPEGPALRNLGSAVVAVAIHPDGRRVAVGYADGSVDVFPDRAAAASIFHLILTDRSVYPQGQRQTDLSLLFERRDPLMHTIRDGAAFALPQPSSGNTKPRNPALPAQSDTPAYAGA